MAACSGGYGCSGISSAGCRRLNNATAAPTLPPTGVEVHDSVTILSVEVLLGNNYSNSNKEKLRELSDPFTFFFPQNSGF